jgi:hypothetical protein
LLLLAAVVRLVACGDDDDGAGHGSRDRTPAPAAGSPSVCEELVADGALSDLTEQLQSVTLEDGSADDLVPAAAELRDFASAFPSATAAADALERWAETPDDAAKTDALASAFAALDAEVQAECDFPLS